MAFLPLETEADLQQAVADSFEKPVLIFKHSGTCHISAAAQASLNHLTPADPVVYRLVVQHARALSNTIAQQFRIRHESPQLLLLIDGMVQAHVSHYGATSNWVREHLQTA